MRKSSSIYLFFAALSVIFLFAVPGFDSQEGRTQYEKALEFIKDKKYDFALMEFRSVIREFPESEYARESLFAIGEYFYDKNAFYTASTHFASYIKGYPDSTATPFARAYLLKITQAAKGPGENGAVHRLETELFSEPLFLLFSDYKEISYESPFQNEFSIRHYIDSIEIYKNGTIFIKFTQ